MDNNAFQDALDKGFAKFRAFARSTSVGDKAALIGSVGLLYSAYFMASTPTNELPYYLSGEGWQFTKELFSLAATPLATAAFAAYAKVSLINNGLTWLDHEEGYKAPKVETIDPAKFVGPVKPAGFFKRHTESVKNAVSGAVDKAVDAYDGWDEKGFKGAIKRNLEDFKTSLRAVSIEDAGVYAACVVVAATLYDGVVMNGFAAPVTDLLQSGSVDYGLEALHKFTGIFNKNITMSAQGFSALAGAKIALKNWDDSRADKKAAAQEQDGGGPSGPSGQSADAGSSTSEVSDPVVAVDAGPEIEPDNSGANAVSSFLASKGFEAAGSVQDAKSSLDQVKRHDKSLGM